MRRSILIQIQTNATPRSTGSEAQEYWLVLAVRLNSNCVSACELPKRRNCGAPRREIAGFSRIPVKNCFESRQLITSSYSHHHTGPPVFILGPVVCQPNRSGGTLLNGAADHDAPRTRGRGSPHPLGRTLALIASFSDSLSPFSPSPDNFTTLNISLHALDTYGPGKGMLSTASGYYGTVLQRFRNEIEERGLLGGFNRFRLMLTRALPSSCRPLRSSCHFSQLRSLSATSAGGCHPS